MGAGSAFAGGRIGELVKVHVLDEAPVNLFQERTWGARAGVLTIRSRFTSSCGLWRRQASMPGKS
jgi:hypothetical protein